MSLGLELYFCFSAYFLPSTFGVHLEKLFGNTNWDYKELRNESHFVTSLEASPNKKTLETDILFQWCSHSHVLAQNRTDIVTDMMANAQHAI